MRFLSLSVCILVPAMAFAQRSMPTPDESFNRLLASYGGTGDVVDWSKVSQESRDRYNRFASFSNLPPMPTSGTITRAQYTEDFNKRMESMRANGGWGGNRGGSPQASPAPAMPPGTPGAPPAEKTVNDDEVTRWLRRYDKNDDGKISLEEAQSSDRLRPIFANYDTNRDGFIDAPEFKVYMTDRMNNRVPDQGNNNNPPPPPPPQYTSVDQGRDNRGRNDSVAPPAEEKPPVVIRYGKLPMKELPSWFETLDTDKDGQIGLYEWRAANKPTAEFVAMDLNGDGLLTAEEYLRWKKISSGSPASTPTASASAAVTTKETKESKKDDRGGKNAFRR